MSHPLESKPILPGDQPIESPEPLLEGLRQIAQIYPLPDTVRKEIGKRTRPTADPMSKNEAVAFFKDAYVRARLNTPSEAAIPPVLPPAFLYSEDNEQLEDVRSTLASFIRHAEKLSPMEGEAATIWTKTLTEIQRQQVMTYLQEHEIDGNELTYIQKLSALELIDRDWLLKRERHEEDQEAKRAEIASQQFTRKVNSGVSRFVGSIWGCISGTSEGVALGVSHSPAVAAVFGPAMEIAGAIALREAAIALTATSYGPETLLGGIGLGFAGLWLTATGARVVYRAARKILDSEIDKRKAAILSSLIAIGTIAGAQAAAPVIVQFAADHQPSVVVLPNGSSTEQPKPTEASSFRLKTDTSPSPFTTPFVWESPHIAKRMFDSVDWARVDRWEPLIDEALAATGLGDELKGLGYDSRALIKAIMLVESRGNEKALSGAGAVGLMQVMPSDGPSGMKGRSITYDLFDPEHNLHDGMVIFKGDLDREKGSVSQALVDYIGRKSKQGPEYSQFVLTLYNAIISVK